MRYLLVDRITDWKKDEHISGVKNVAMTEDFLEFHFPGNPIMPGVLLLEALAQLSGWLVAASSDFGSWFLLSKVTQCKFYGFALPGDQVVLEVKALPGPEQGMAAYRASGLVEGKRKIVAEFEGDLVPLATIENREEQMKLFRVLMRTP
jgi:3-hydroxyacyl-[acyl-carrier-protein] dehydratase